MAKRRFAEHAAELWTRQKGLCWICKSAIPEDRQKTSVDLNHRYAGGKPKLPHMSLSCRSCVSRRIALNRARA